MIKEGKELLYLSQAEIMQMDISLEQVLSLVEIIFKEKAKGDLQNPPKAIIPIALNCNSSAMPALLQSTDFFGMNWQSCFNANEKIGLPPNSGVIGLYRKPTGIQLAILEDSYIDALCRGAMAGLCAKYLAKKDSSTVSIIGCGYWSESYLKGVLLSMPGLKTVRIYDRLENRRNLWILQIQKVMKELEFQTTGLKEAVQQADILITGDVLQRELDENEKIGLGLLKKGCVVISTNQDQQFDKDVINQDIDTIVTDDLKQYTDKKEFYVKDITNEPIDLVDFISGITERQSKEETFFCCLLGMSASNTLVAYDVFQRALKRGLGQVMVL